MQHTISAVSTLASEGEIRSIAIKLRAPLDHFFDSRTSFFGEHPNPFHVAQAISSNECVLKMQADLIFIAECRSDSALGVVGGRVMQFALCEHDDSACLCKFNSSTQSCDPSSNH